MCNKSSFYIPVTARFGVFAFTVFIATVCVAEQLADPTQPPGISSTAGNSKVVNNAPSWILHSTLIAGDRRVATINGQTVSVGAQVDGATVLLIEPGYVRLRIGKQERQLELLPKEIKYVAQGDAHGH